MLGVLSKLNFLDKKLTFRTVCKAKNTSDTSKKRIIECIEIDTSTSKLPKEPQNQGSKIDEVIDSSIICGSCSKSGEKSVISRCNICNLKCHLDCMIIVQNQKVCDGCKPIFV